NNDLAEVVKSKVEGSGVVR
nr:hypothetical protein [Tanacetum cinerariifolium]